MAVSREANCLPPCREVKGIKTGARDAAIWLSAIEYAREHPDETVYFASSNTKDFGDGTDYPPLLKQDLAGLEDRFVHWTSLAQVVSHFTEQVETDMDVVTELLRAPELLKQVTAAAHTTGCFPWDGSWQCRVYTSAFAAESAVVPVSSWLTTGSITHRVQAAQMYRLGEQEWCTAEVSWYLAGYMASLETPTETTGWAMPVKMAGCEWNATVLFRLDTTDPRLTVLRGSQPLPLTAAELGGMPLSLFGRTQAE